MVEHKTRHAYNPPPPPRFSSHTGGTPPRGLVSTTTTTDFFVGDFSGEKSLIVSNLSLMGARNPYLGIAYIALGSLSLAIGLAFLIKHLSNPRKLGDTRFLVWKVTTL